MNEPIKGRMGAKMSRVECLMVYVRGACELKRGTKAALARYLGVQPHMISAWLAGAKPNAENALGMVEWMNKQKRTSAPPSDA